MRELFPEELLVVDELVVDLVHALAATNLLQGTADVLRFTFCNIQGVVPRDSGDLDALLVFVEMQPFDGGDMRVAVPVVVDDAYGAERVLEWVQIEAKHAVILPLVARLGILQVFGRGQNQFLVGVLYELAEFVVVEFDQLIVLVVDGDAAPQRRFLNLYIFDGPVQLSRQLDYFHSVTIPALLQGGYRFGRHVMKKPWLLPIIIRF